MAKRKPLAEIAAQEQPKDNLPAVLTERERRAALVPTLKCGGRLDVTQEQKDAMLDAMCTDHPLVLSGAINAASACNPYEGEEADRQRNLALRLLTEIAPQNAVERMLVQQLIAADMAASVCLGVGTYKTNDAQSRRKSLNLACQFMSVQARQIELLHKLRNGNQQIVKVVHVHQGAQAIIGDVTQGGGGGGNDR